MDADTVTYDGETDFLTVETGRDGTYEETVTAGEMGVNLSSAGEVLSCEVVNASQVFGLEPSELEQVEDVAVQTEDRGGETVVTVTVGGATRSRYSVALPDAAVV